MTSSALRVAYLSLRQKMDKIRCRTVVEYLQKKGFSSKKIVKTYVQKAPSSATVKNSHEKLTVWKTTPKFTFKAYNNGTITSVNELVMEDPCLTVKNIATTLAISTASVHYILTQGLAMQKVFAKWIKKLLTPDQKWMLLDNVCRYESNPAEFVKKNHNHGGDMGSSQ